MKISCLDAYENRRRYIFKKFFFRDLIVKVTYFYVKITHLPNSSYPSITIHFRTTERPRIASRDENVHVHQCVFLILSRTKNGISRRMRRSFSKCAVRLHQCHAAIDEHDNAAKTTSPIRCRTKTISPSLIISTRNSYADDIILQFVYSVYGAGAAPRSRVQLRATKSPISDHGMASRARGHLHSLSPAAFRARRFGARARPGVSLKNVYD